MKAIHRILTSERLLALVAYLDLIKRAAFFIFIAVEGVTSSRSVRCHMIEIISSFQLKFSTFNHCYLGNFYQMVCEGLILTF